MTVNNTAWRDVYRPTMFRKLKVEGNKGTEVVMYKKDVPPARDPIAIGSGTEWANDNDYSIGSTVRVFTALFTGGSADSITYRHRFQKRANAGSEWVNLSWSNYDNTDKTVEYVIAEAGQLRFQCQAKDATEQINSFASVETIAALPPLSVGSVTATGKPFVGYTLSCSAPTVTGGSGTIQTDYFWVDETNAMVWDAAYMSNAYTVTDADLGRTMKCIVTVTDKVTNESIPVMSNEMGPINRPIIPEYECFVDSNLYDDPSLQIGVAVNGSVVMEVKPETVSNPALDLSYRWQVRSGTGRLSGDENSTGIIYIAPDSAPAGALVTCTVSSNNAADNAQAAEVTIIITE